MPEQASGENLPPTDRGLKEPGDHRKIDNTGGTFMPVSIDVLSVDRQTIEGRESGTA